MPYLSLHSDFGRVSVVLGLPHNCQSCGKMTVDLLADLFVYVQIEINAIWRLTLLHVLKKSLELKFWFENIAFVLTNKCK